MEYEIGQDTGSYRFSQDRDRYYRGLYIFKCPGQYCMAADARSQSQEEKQEPVHGGIAGESPAPGHRSQQKNCRSRSRYNKGIGKGSYPGAYLAPN